MRRLLAVALAATLSGCVNEIDQSTRPDALVGTYQLVTPGGARLPYMLRADTITVEVLDAPVVLGADRTWIETLHLRRPTRERAAPGTTSAPGSWTTLREAAYISFNDKLNRYQFSGTAAGRTVVLHLESGEEMVYRR